MSLDRAIHHGKEHRRTYRERGLPGEGDRTCRPHGGGVRTWACTYCERNRLLSSLRRVDAAARLQDTTTADR